MKFFANLRILPLYIFNLLALFSTTNFACYANGNIDSIKVHDSSTNLKQYEFCNHLLNVNTVIDSKKIPVDLSQIGIVDAYTAKIASTSDYSPFGVKLDARGFSEKYRYGFNGKEEDKENDALGSQSVYDYGFRVYTPSLGRFLSIDPLSPNYPFYTPYQFAGNKPIENVDLDGLEEYHYKYLLHNGKPYIQISVNIYTDYKPGGLSAAQILPIVNQEVVAMVPQKMFEQARVEAERKYFRERAQTRQAQANFAAWKAKCNNPFWVMAQLSDVSDLADAAGFAYQGNYRQMAMSLGFFFLPETFEQGVKHVLKATRKVDKVAVTVYRGGATFEARTPWTHPEAKSMDVDFDGNQMITGSKGISLNEDFNKVRNRGKNNKTLGDQRGAFVITHMPEGLKVKDTGGGHFEIVPDIKEGTKMHFDDYQNLLNQIKSERVYKATN